MTYHVEYTPEAVRCLNKLPTKIVEQVVPFIADILAAEPKRIGKPMRTDSGPQQWSARRTTFRILYTIDEDRIVISIVRVAHRADAYR